MQTQRPFRVVIIFLVLAIIGVACIPGLNINFTPTYSTPALHISYSLPNASPDIVERLATSPLENALSQIEGTNTLESTSAYNRGYITMTFDKGEDMEFRKFEVNAIIRNLYKKLPENMSYPRVDQRGGQDADEQRSSMLMFSINGPYAPFKLQQDVEEYVRKPLSQLRDIHSIEISGGNPLQITIDFDAMALIRYRLSKADISRALNSYNSAVYAGLAKLPGGQQYFLKTTAQIPDIPDLERTEVAVVSGKPIYLKDIASVYVEEQEPTSYTRINGQNAVYMSVYARPSVNKIVLAKQVRAQIEELKHQLPSDVEIRLEQDETEYLQEEMDKIYMRTGMSIAILVLFIFIINRNLRYLFTLFLGILVNLCITAIIIYALNVELHIYSIAGLTISFGLIVDNAIVMLDHLHRKKNSKIFLALMAASITTILALLVVLLLPEEDRRDLTDFSIVVSINLATSLLIALFFSPALYQLLFGYQLKRKETALTFRKLRRKVRGFQFYGRIISFVVRYRKAFIVVVILAFGLPVFQLPVQIEGQDWYNKTIGSDKYQDDIRPIVDKALGGALRKFVTEVYEGYYYSTPERTKLMVVARLPFGTTLDDANYAMSKIEEYLTTVEGIDKYVTRVNNLSGSIEITFEEAYDNSAMPYQLKARLQARSLDLTGVQWSIFGIGQGFSVGGESNQTPSYSVIMKGYNYDELGRQAEIFANRLEQHVRVQKVNTNAQLGYSRVKTSEYVLNFDVQRLADAGLSRSRIVQTLGDLTKPGGRSLEANLNNQRLPVYIKAKNAEEFSKWDLMQEALPIDTARLVKIKDYATLTFEETANELKKEDRQYLRRLSFDYLGSSNFGRKYLEKSIEEMEEILPIGYSIESNNRYFSFKQKQRQYSLLPLLMVGIFFVCAILFENLKQPLYIIITIPISFIGLFLIFSLFDFRFDPGGFAAFIMLGGLVVNASIFVVNDLNNTRLKHYNRSVIRSVLGKAQPILLTILSTCFGLIPFLVEGESEYFWFALAIGTIGGLVFSTLAVFLCLPVFLSSRKQLINNRR
ncbi:efflux RND transporter permease subunit [Roseivirga sp. UBA838]|uniref:efflux RND transporter permease subunit n=1 Tax=Roseivirga sp. UBA838 TaxID=1947393 RepID=UPI002580D139|nr:efflux RND transporter permease subunit [Roseivirga sp. UBA838]|tara:strand:- start:33841 stop:36972 length:3132 start_codon:yes stop_codon:yes gene_type:complete